jgi:hypothetical protein
MTVIHVVFVVSSLLLALSDRFAEHSRSVAVPVHEQEGAGHAASGAVHH